MGTETIDWNAIQVSASAGIVVNHIAGLGAALAADGQKIPVPWHWPLLAIHASSLPIPFCTCRCSRTSITSTMDRDAKGEESSQPVVQPKSPELPLSIKK